MRYRLIHAHADNLWFWVCDITERESQSYPTKSEARRAMAEGRVSWLLT